VKRAKQLSVLMIDILSRVGISSPLFSFSSLGQSIDEISGRFKRWEIVAELEHCPQIIIQKKDLLFTSGMEITIHAPFSDLNIASLDKRAREFSVERIDEAIVAAYEMGGIMVTMHPGFFSPLGFLIPEKIDTLSSDSITRLGARAEDLGVTLALENMPPWQGSIGDDVEDLIKRVEGTGVKICFDVGHAHIGSGVENFIERSDLIANVHIHENDGKVDLHLPLGSGQMDVIDIMKRLIKKGYKGPFIIESRNFEEGVQGLDYLTEHFSD